MNVLVRYFTQDDPVQSTKANEIVDRLSEATPGYITAIVLAEVYWVLRDSYKIDRTTILSTLRGLLDSKEVVVERSDTIRRALRRAEAGADLSDALIFEFGVEAGCDRTVTFDEKAAKRAGMQLIA